MDCLVDTHQSNHKEDTRRVLAQPCGASAAERNWSVYGQIKTKARSRMGHSTGDKLVYCHEALHMRAKLHEDAGYTQHTSTRTSGTPTLTLTSRTMNKT